MSNHIDKDNFNSLVPCIRVQSVKQTMEYDTSKLGFKPRYFIKGNPDFPYSVLNVLIDFIP